MIHAISIRQLEQNVNFVKGHHYMLVDWTEEFCDNEKLQENLRCRVVKFLKKNPEQFKLVYESIPFRNSSHRYILYPYLKLYILEKL